MKITYFGTAAAEGFPALFCNCAYCNDAAKAGGKNIRTRSQAMINEDLLIDLPADTYAHFLQNHVEGDKIRYILITHAHSDHFYPMDLFMRYDCYAHNMRVDTLKLLCSESVQKRLERIPDNVEVVTVKPYEPLELGAYSIIPLPARHMLEEEAFIYIIQGEKTILYAHDTGYFYEDVFACIENGGFVFDMVSLDCTNVDIPISDEGTHMGFPNIARVLARLEAMGAVTDKTIKYVNHFSHNGNPMQHLLEKRAEEYGCLVSYDGCTLEI